MSPEGKVREVLSSKSLKCCEESCLVNELMVRLPHLGQPSGPCTDVSNQGLGAMCYGKKLIMQNWQFCLKSIGVIVTIDWRMIVGLFS